MSGYDATGLCRNLACTVLRYAYDTSGRSEAPGCPACEQRDRADALAARLAAVEGALTHAEQLPDAGNLYHDVTYRDGVEHTVTRLRAALATGTEGQS